MPVRIWRDPNAGRYYHQFVCACGNRSPVIGDPARSAEEAAVLVRRRQWTGAGEDWACPICRVRALVILSEAGQTWMAVPTGLAGDLQRHFLREGLSFQVTSDPDGSQRFTFPSGPDAAQLAAILRRWTGSGYVFGQIATEEAT